ncbi:MAG: hypothetical protein P8H62_07330 [Henriciella sp.]|nr:hypothetical protein [Henriciella sp.]
MMSSFENRLKASLSAEDEAFLKDLEPDAGLFQQMGSTFAGPLGGWTVYAFIMSFAMFGLSVWSIWNIFHVETTREMILWLALASFTMLGVGLIKMWFWMRMNHLAVLRELKMIELRLVKGD